MSTTPDFRTEEPVWVKYAEWVGQGHDKFYEVRVDLDDDGTFYLTKRWGRRPDAGGGQIKVERYDDLTGATTNADAMLGKKLLKGYCMVERPHGADNQVTHEYGEDYYAEGSEAF